MSSQLSPMIDAQQQIDQKLVFQWINQLSNPVTRDYALNELSKNRDHINNLGPMLWHSYATMYALLEETINVYPAISPPTLTADQSIRVCNALVLLQRVATHAETRRAFLQTQVLLCLYPFLSSTCATHPFEYLRLTSLCFIGALVKTNMKEAITFLLTTEIVRLCLLIMETGSELSKIAATYILKKILLDEFGLSYICQNYEHLSHVAFILGKIVIQMGKKPCTRLLQQVVGCYLRLSDNPRGRVALHKYLPVQWLQMLIKNLDLDVGVNVGGDSLWRCF